MGGYCNLGLSYFGFNGIKILFDMHICILYSFFFFNIL
jgi:hypothetical protein